MCPRSGYMTDEGCCPLTASNIQIHSVHFLFPSVRPPALVFNRLPVKFLRASDPHSAAETSISGAVHRKLMFHAQFSGITGELYAVGQIRLMSAGEIFLTATILASEKGRLCGPLNPADRNGGCVPSFLSAEARCRREVWWLPKAGDAASQRSYSSSRVARSALPLPPAASGLPSEKMLQ